MGRLVAAADGGVAVAMVPLAFVLLLQQGVIPPPQLTRIVVNRDTVWFIGAWYDSRDPERRPNSVVYALVRQSGQWVRTTPHTFSPDPVTVPASRRDTVRMHPGYDLVRIGPGTGLLTILARDTRRLVPLRPFLTPEARNLRPRGGIWYGLDFQGSIERLPLGGANGTWAVGPDAIWLGTSGGFSEGFGAVGSLFRFDMKTRTLESIWADLLLQSKTTSLSLAHGALWIGTLSEGEYGPGPAEGLLRYDTSARTWSQFRVDSTPLPGDVVWTTATDGERVWIATNGGVAEIDQDGRWRVGYFAPAMRGDTLVFELTSVRPSPVAAKVLYLARRLEIPPTPEFIAAAQTIPPERLECLIDLQSMYDQCVVDVLAVPALAPFLRDALSGRGAGIAAKALGKLGDRDAIPALREALRVQSQVRPAIFAEDRAAIFAEVLWSSLGDSTGLTWVRDRLRLDPTTSVMFAAARMRDMASVPVLIAMLGSPALEGSAINALSLYESKAVWVQTADGALADPSRAGSFLHGLYTNGAFRGNPDVAEKAHRVALIALRHPDPSVQRAGATHLVRFSKDTTGIPHLIRLLTEDPEHGGDILEELVRATAVDSVPAPPFGATEAQLATARAFWTAWWQRSRATFGFADEVAGVAAYRRWRDRWPDPE